MPWLLLQRLLRPLTCDYVLITSQLMIASSQSLLDGQNVFDRFLLGCISSIRIVRQCNTTQTAH